jgi:hypothetical protein
MGADAFIGFYGIEVVLLPGEVTAVETKTDERVVRARKNKLLCHLGRITDGEPYHLLIGKEIAWLGLEHNAAVTCSDDTLAAIQEEVRKKLMNAGFTENPRLIFKIHTQY